MAEKEELGQSLLVKRDSGIVESLNQEEVFENEIVLDGDNMNEAQKLLKQENRKVTKSPAKIIKEGEKEAFMSKLNKIGEDDSEISDDSNEVVEDKTIESNNSEKKEKDLSDMRSKDESEDSKFEARDDAINDAMGEIMDNTRPKQEEGDKRKDRIDNFMDDLESEKGKRKRRKKRVKKKEKIIRKLNNQDEDDEKKKEEQEAERVKILQNKVINRFANRKFDNLKEKAKRMKNSLKNKYIKDGVMDTDGNKIQSFEVDNEDFGLKQYVKDLDVLQMETREDLLQHYKELLNEGNPEFFKLWNESTRFQLQDQKKFDNQRVERDSISIFSTMSGMQSVEYFERSSAHAITEKSMVDQTERLGLISGEQDFMEFLRRERAKRKKDENDKSVETKDSVSDESFVFSEGEGEEKPLVQADNVNSEKLVDDDNEVIDELNAPNELPKLTDEELDKKIADEENKEQTKLFVNKKSFKHVKPKKIQDKDLLKSMSEKALEKKDNESDTTELTEESDMLSEDKEASTHSNTSSYSNKSEEEAEEEDSKNNKKGQQSEDSNNKSEKSEKSEKSKKEDTDEDAALVKDPNLEAEKLEEKSDKDEEGDVPVQEFKPDLDLKKMEDAQEHLKNIDEKLKESKKEKETNQPDNENDQSINMDGITNPVQGQQKEEEEEETFAQKKVSEKRKELDEKRATEDKSKNQEQEADTKFNRIPLNYIVPEMPSFEIKNYHNEEKAKKIEDFTNTEIVEQISMSARNLTEEKNRNKHYELGRIYRFYKLLPFCIQRAIESCRPNMDEVKQTCADFHKKECYEFNYIVRLNCLSNESYFNGACYRNCPDDMKDSKVACIKAPAKKRRVENLEDPIGKEYDEKFAERFFVTRCSEFGPSYVPLGPDLCLQECPYGWKDLGKICLKPFRYKNQKAFFYDSSMV